MKPYPKKVAKRRSRLTIYLDILDVVGHGASRVTHIIYGTNLDYRTAVTHLSHLMDKQLIARVQGQYFLTEEGHIALKHGVDFKWAVLP